jgi:hypothetical protein
MPHAEPPRKISMAYILGLSPHPFKQPKPPIPPPRPKESNPYVSMVTTPGAVLEWAASDGRKGKLSTPAPPKLTSRNLAKVPSEKPIGKKTASTQAHRSSNDQARKKERKEKKDESQGWAADKGDCDWPNPASASGSKKNKKDETPAWEFTWGQPAGSTKSDGSKKSGSKKDEPSTDPSWGENNDAMGSPDAIPTVNNTSDNKDANVDDKRGEGQVWDNSNWGETPADAGGYNAGGRILDKADAQNTDIKTDDNAKADESAKHDHKVAEGSNEWTAEQDTELLKLKSENVSMSWDAIAQMLGKGTKETCKARFNKVKPKDWKPQCKGKGGDGGNKSNQSQAKEAEKEKEGDAGDDGFLGGGLFGNLGMNDDAGGGGRGDGGPVQSPVKSSGFDASADPWTTPANTSWGPQTQQQSPVVNDCTNAFAAAMRSSRGQALNKQFANRSPGIQPPNPFSATFHKTPQPFSQNFESNGSFHDIYPDVNFSQQDILIIAKLLKEDHQLLWNRIASRFRDKTGRNLHPWTFEEKVTGKSRRKEDSERPGRMGSVRNWRG